jgi:esterase/lipase superfamily enzyme
MSNQSCKCSGLRRLIASTTRFAQSEIWRYLPAFVGLALFYWAIPSSSAQEVQVVLGIVQNTDPSHTIVGSGIINAPVRLCEADPKMPHNCRALVTALTDSDGRFQIAIPDLVSDKSYSLQIQFGTSGIRAVPLGKGDEAADWIKEQNVSINELDFAEPTSTSFPVTPPSDSVNRGNPAPRVPTGFKRVFFATDRGTTEHSGAILVANTNALDGKLVYGKCDVTIDLQAGQSDTLLNVFRDRNARQYYTIRNIAQLSQGVMMSSLIDAMKANSSHDVLLFIHGYNVAFDDACRRAAQLAYDIKFQGQVVLYSWPSHNSFLAYSGDEEMVQWSGSHFNAFLKQLLDQEGINHLHIVAHSMGNRLLAGALFSGAITSRERIHLGEIVFAAPDINRLIFDQYRGFDKLTPKRTTLYASDHDQALRLSKLFHGYGRVGDSRPDIELQPGVDSIDASAVDTSFLGHSYIGESRSVLADLAILISSGSSPDKRFGILEMGQSPRQWWVIKP